MMLYEEYILNSPQHFSPTSIALKVKQKISAGRDVVNLELLLLLLHCQEWEKVELLWKAVVWLLKS